MNSSFPDRRVVLWGIGHTNALILRAWRDRPLPGAQLIAISNAAISTYSGMLPGVLAGQYPREQMQIDLARLCESAGARFVRADVAGIDLNERRLVFEDREPIDFDVLSIGIGSVPSRWGVIGADDDRVISIKPMTTFLDRLALHLIEASNAASGRAVRIAVVGGGAGGVEITFCLPAFVRRTLGDVAIELSLIHDGETLGAGAVGSTNIRVRRRLEERGVSLRLGHRVTRVDRGYLILNDGPTLESDLTIWATGASAPPFLAKLGLPVDDRGFLLTRPTLQVVTGAPIFVVGDSGTILGAPAPKAGVHAVREAPILSENLGRILDGRPLLPYRPQSSFLRLINTGDGRAIGEYLGFSFEGRWGWWLKDGIDRRFMERFKSESCSR